VVVLLLIGEAGR